MPLDLFEALVSTSKRLGYGSKPNNLMRQILERAAFRKHDFDKPLSGHWSDDAIHSHNVGVVIKTEAKEKLTQDASDAGIPRRTYAITKLRIALDHNLIN